MTWFTRKVFRPNDRWAVGLFAAILLVQVASAILHVSGPGALSLVTGDLSWWEGNSWCVLVALVWTGSESLAHHRMLRRRMALGLADPIVVNRMLLWGCAMISSGVLTMVTLVMGLLGIQYLGTALSAAIVGPFGIMTSSCIFLAFMPPKWFLNRIRATAQLSAVGA